VIQPWRAPALDIGGTHVSSALVDASGPVPVISRVNRIHLDSHASKDEIIGRILAAAGLVANQNRSPWGISIPGPFDYDSGIGDFRGVGKFESLIGVDLRAVFESSGPFAGAHAVFINDAEAYAIGEWIAAGRPDRLMCITLGTGIGSGFLVGGSPVTEGPQVPVDGNIHNFTHDGLPLENFVSRQALIDAYAAAASETVEVIDIVQRTRNGDGIASIVLSDAMGVLGQALATSIVKFSPNLVIVGGAISRSWDVVAPLLLASISNHIGGIGPKIQQAVLLDSAPLLGAAFWANLGH
jgi:glucokinase